MTAPAATLATFADFRLIKGRKQAQLVFEVPIEKADEALAALGGLPRSDSERWCGIALVNSGSQPEAGPQTTTPQVVAASPEAEAQAADRPRRAFHTLPRSQQAGMLCNDAGFQRWILGSIVFTEKPPDERPDECAEHVRHMTGVRSRAELDTDPVCRQRWDNLAARYRQETGLQAEER